MTDAKREELALRLSERCELSKLTSSHGLTQAQRPRALPASDEMAASSREVGLPSFDFFLFEPLSRASKPSMRWRHSDLTQHWEWARNWMSNYRSYQKSLKYVHMCSLKNHSWTSSDWILFFRKGEGRLECQQASILLNLAVCLGRYTFWLSFFVYDNTSCWDKLTFNKLLF